MRLTTGDETIDRQIFSFLLSLATAFILRILQPKARVRWYVPHRFTFFLPPQNQGDRGVLVHTSTLRIENVGRGAAKNVEVHHAFRPPNFQIWPTMNFTQTENPQGIHIIKFENLAPKEGVSLEILSLNTDPPLLSRVRHEGGDARSVAMRTQPVVPHSVLWLLYTLMVIGASTVFYWLLTFGARYM